jgi:hypothetical protein
MEILTQQTRNARARQVYHFVYFPWRHSKAVLSTLWDLNDGKSPLLNLLMQRAHVVSAGFAGFQCELTSCPSSVLKNF